MVVPLGMAGAIRHGAGAPVQSGAAAATPARPAIGHGFVGSPFVANRGQFDPRVRFAMPGAGSVASFMAGGPILATTRGAARWAVRQILVGGRPGVAPVGEGRSGGTMAYFRGSSGGWISGVPTFARIVYRRVWPGIDVVYSVSKGSLEYTFVVSPGADPGRIRVSYRGARAALTATGEIALQAGGVPLFRDRALRAFQVRDGVERPVDVAFTRPGVSGAFGLALGAFDHSRPLVIDPASIGFAGYIGGTDIDDGLAIAADDSGNAYVVGQTKSDERSFPVKVGPDLTLNGQTDAFVCKVNVTGQMVYCGYIGGAQPDRGRGVAVDSNGNAYVYGWTRSKNKDGFPVTVGPDLTYNGGTSDTFLCKVNASGTKLVYCGYIGGNDHDEGKAVAVDSAGAAYVTGGTKSADMPVTPGSFGQTYAGDGDVFVAEVRPGGTGLMWLGYVGGAGSEHARGIGVAPDGYVSFAGTTNSNQSSLPVKVGPDLTYNGGDGDAFVGRITPGGSSLTYLGYIGGSGFDDARDGTVGDAGNLILCGHTASTQGTFPVTVGPDLTYNGGRTDGFVALVHPDATLGFAGYIGGSAADACYGVDVDHNGNVFATGRTFSNQISFPVGGGPDSTYNGGGDAFAVEVVAGGHGFVYGGYVGGSDKDVGWGLSLGPNDVAYLTGQTLSTQGSFPVKGGPDLTYNGLGDAFVASVLPS